MYDLIIIGGGPSGVAAGVYAARKQIKTALITESFGGQSFVSADIQNWIGTKSISGLELAKTFEEHVRAQKGIEIITGDVVTKVEDKGESFTLTTKNGQTLESKYLLICTGSHRRRLGIPGEAEHEGKGVVYCSICDAPLFKGREVAVIGGGNAGLEAVIDLLPYASKITLIIRSDRMKGDAVTQEKIKADPKVEIMYQIETKEVLGDKMVSGIKYLDKKDNQEKELAVQGVFVEIGAVPSSDIVEGLVNINERKEIVVDHKTEQTSHPRIWAVGDVSDVLYKQNNISAGDAVKAVLNIYERMVKGEK